MTTASPHRHAGRAPVRRRGARARAAATLLALAAAVAATGPAACGSAGTEDGGRATAEAAGAVAPAARASRLAIVAIDLSGSRNEAQLAETRQFADGVVEALANGDRLILLEMYEKGPSAIPRQWSDTVRRARDPERLTPSDRHRVESAQRAARAVLPAFFDSTRAGKVQGTDVISTLHRAADYAREAGGRRVTLYLLSDMIHEANGVSFAGAVPSASWADEQKAKGLLPNLAGVCVVAVGPEVSTPRGVAVRDLWKRYLAAAGAELRESNWRNMASSATSVGCD